MTHSEHHAALVAYLRAKVDVQDWHGVSDAANDLRVLEAEQKNRVRIHDLDPATLRPRGTFADVVNNYREKSGIPDTEGGTRERGI